MRSRRLTQRLDPPEPYADLVPTGERLVHHLQAVDFKRLKLPTHFIYRTAVAEGPIVQPSPQPLPSGRLDRPKGEVDTSASSSDGRSSEAAQTAKMVVSEQGYEPAKLTLRASTPARITFVRTTDKACETEVVFPSLNIKRGLPLNEPVVIVFTPVKSEDTAFACVYEHAARHGCGAVRWTHEERFV